MRDALLVYLGRSGGFEGWLRLRDGAVAARGPGLDGIEAERGAPVVAVAPGEQVTLRWIELPQGLSTAQATAAARLAAAEWAAQPLAEVHLALGPDREGGRFAAIAPTAAVAAWLAELRQAGLEPNRLIPEPLLLLPPEAGVAVFDRGPLRLVRGRTEAFALEPDLAELLLDGQPVTPLSQPEFEAEVARALSDAPLDLRQGTFARSREIKLESGRLRRLALLGAALLLATVTVELAAIARYSLAADAAEAETRRIAAAAIPRGRDVANPSRALQRRLGELRGGGMGFTATAAALFEAVKATPDVELSATAFTPDGTLRATVGAQSAPALEALRARIDASGFTAETTAPRAGGGRRIADLLVRPR